MDVIVVGVDGSETAHRAAVVAAQLAAMADARLHLVNSYQEKPSKALDGGPEFGVITSLDQAEGLLASLASELRSSVREVTHAAVEGRPADAVCSEASSVGADLIVVGNKRVQGASRVLGSVASKILQHSPCDVYVAHTVA